MIRPIVGVQRRISVRPASDGYFQDRDVQLNLAGIEIKVENTSYGPLDRSEQSFPSKEEAAWLDAHSRDRSGSCFEQYHWDTDVTDESCSREFDAARESADALDTARKELAARTVEIDAWASLSASTDHHDTR